jgi:MOSC domain-containing protein YiiM
MSPMHASATVIAVNTSPGGIPKTPLQSGRVDVDGVRGDGHNHSKHVTPMQAICLIDAEDLDDLRDECYDVHPGATGENITLRGLKPPGVDALAVGDRLRFSGGVEIELTKARKPCYVLDAIDPALKTAIRGRCGYYAKVITTGEVRPGETVEVIPASAAISGGQAKARD